MIPIDIEDMTSFNEVGDIISDLLYKIINSVSTDGYYTETKANVTSQIYLNPDTLQFILRFNDRKKIKKLIFIEPSKLSILARWYKLELRKSKLDSDKLYSIFVDKVYKRNNFPRKKLIDSIGLKTCPYCNRNYIYTIKSGKINPELDHFYPKSIYPILAVSLYNLIPSCPTCNSSGSKGTKDPGGTQYSELRSPYLIQHDDFHFNYKLLSPAIVKGKYSGESIDIYFDTCKYKVNEQVFHLGELYKKHDDHIVDMLYKRRYVYTNNFLRTLAKITASSINNMDVNRFVVGAYVIDNEYHKRPLSKLYAEIAKEIGLIK